MKYPISQETETLLREGLGRSGTPIPTVLSNVSNINRHRDMPVNQVKRLGSNARLGKVGTDSQSNKVRSQVIG